MLLSFRLTKKGTINENDQSPDEIFQSVYIPTSRQQYQVESNNKQLRTGQRSHDVHLCPIWCWGKEEQ